MREARDAALAGSNGFGHAGTTSTLPTRDAVGVRLTLLGNFELTGRDGPLPLPPGGQRVVAFLALRGRWVVRSVVAGTLWPDSREEHANGNLRTALWRINQPGRAIVDASRTHLRLGRDLQVDVHDVTDRARRLISGWSQPDGGIVDPVRLRSALTADLLADWDEHWVVVERERIRHLRLHALESLCERLTDEGRFAEAVEAGMAAVEIDPLRESAQRTLIRAHVAEGNVAEAMRQLQAYRRVLTDELGIVPSTQLEDLVRPVRI